VVQDVDGDGRKEILTVHASARTRQDLLSLIDAHGRLRWRRDATRLDSGKEEDLNDVGWCTLSRPRKTGATGLGVLTIRRSHQGSLSLVDRIDLASGRSLGLLRNYGHIEDLFEIDLDARPGDEVALTGVDQRTGGALVVILDEEHLDAGANRDEIESILDVTDPAALDHGVRAAWIFPNDSFLQSVRGRAESITKVSDGVIQVSCDAARGGAAIFEMEAGDPGQPKVVRVVISDAARAVLLGGGVRPAEIVEEEERLAGEVKTLTEDGWRLAGRISSGSPAGGQ
jgi:hypothetical protein